ncbi:MAG: Na+/proline symporter [Candidatus Methanohalarchaeum thermophilum]|uniref:Na+/proline symporter n=1 Tax=Methanohalarchaeum thermophilum TaxID=1903181 RepID=A0A1Q6DWA1_METT1|nr:MAG: Na+/proline symporter [Candidatus Methanohalarchaeum thermophilum]
MKPVILYSGLLVWVFIALVLTELGRRRMGEGIFSFVLADRRLSGFISAMTYSATTYSAFMMIGLVGLTYTAGVAALGFEMTYLIFTVLLLIVFAPRFWVAGQRFDHLTPPELLKDRYSSSLVGATAAVICLVMLIPYLSVQLMGSGYLFVELTNGQVSYMTGVLIMAVFGAVVTLIAGMRAVSFTDAFQAITMLITSIILLFYIFYAFFGSPIGFFDVMSSNYSELLKVNWSFKKFVGLSLPWAFFAMTNPQVSQRMFVSRDVGSLKKMILYFSIFGFIYTIITTLFGLSAAHIVPNIAQPDKAMPILLTKVPDILALLVFLGIFAAATSTLGSIFLTLGSIASRDIVKTLDVEVSEKSEVNLARFVITLLLVFTIFFARLRLDLIAVLSSMASAGLLVMAPSIIGCFFWKRANSKAAFSSMVTGSILVSALYFFNIYIGGWWPSVVGLLVTVIVFVTVSFLTGEKEDGGFIKEIEEGLIEYNFK